MIGGNDADSPRKFPVFGVICEDPYACIESHELERAAATDMWRFLAGEALLLKVRDVTVRCLAKGCIRCKCDRHERRNDQAAVPLRVHIIFCFRRTVSWACKIVENGCI